MTLLSISKIIPRDNIMCNLFIDIKAHFRYSFSKKKQVLSTSTLQSFQEAEALITCCSIFLFSSAFSKKGPSEFSVGHTSYRGTV